MRTWLTRTAATAGIALAALIVGGVAPATGGEHGAEVLHARLDGAQEVPGPGDDDGRGVFTAVVRGDTLCYVLVAVRIESATAAHIHPGPAGVAGGIAVGLDTPNPVGKGCVTAVPDSEDSTATLSDSELAAILAEPSDFYLNVHNARFEAGAIRGQLR